MKLLTFVLLMGLSAAAQIDAPSAAIKRPVADKKFWALTILNASSAVADSWTTVQGRNAGYIETNPAFGERPSTGKIVAIESGITAAQAWLSYYAKKRCEEGAGKRWCVLWPIPLSASFTIHSVAAAHNYTLVH